MSEYYKELCAYNNERFNGETAWRYNLAPFSQRKIDNVNKSLSIKEI